VTLNPSATPAYDEALAADLGDRPSGFVHRGAEIGAHVAKEILAWRQHDGWVVSAFPPYAEPPLPGRWQPTPPANAAATFTHLQQAAPMALLSATQVLPPPPSLTSARYAADLNEVQLVGKSDSAVRTEEQTTLSRLWSGVGTTTGFFSVWNNVARDVVLARNLSLVETARVFVLVNVSIHDALQTTLSERAQISPVQERGHRSRARGRRTQRARRSPRQCKPWSMQASSFLQPDHQRRPSIPHGRRARLADAAVRVAGGRG
jgi:hypothetical protein